MKQLTRRIICFKCAEFFDLPTPEMAIRIIRAVELCPACQQVDKWMQEASSDSA